MEQVKRIILSHLPAQAKHTRKCISFNCPCCVYMGERRADTRGRGGLFIEADTIGYNCFNCRFKCLYKAGEGLSFRMKKFLELLGVPSIEISRIRFEELRNSSITYKVLGSVSTTVSKPRLDIDFEDVELPRNTCLLHDLISDNSASEDVLDVISYAIDRGVSNHPYLMWVNDTYNKFNRRLMIPYIFRDKVVGYTARCIDPCKKNERYVSVSPNTSKYVFNADCLFKNRKYLIITESPIDSILYDGVATMNFQATKKQINLINEFKGEKIVVPDFGSGGLSMIDTATSEGWGVYFPEWNTKFDLGEASQLYGRIFVLERILTQYVKNSIEIKIRRNLNEDKFKNV